MACALSPGTAASGAWPDSARSRAYALTHRERDVVTALVGGPDAPDCLTPFGHYSAFSSCWSFAS